MFRRLTPVAKNILIINVAIFIAASLINLPLNEQFGLYTVLSENFAPYQFFTYMWLHGGFRHLFYNMIMVFFLGPILEQTWGSKRFATFYLVCGLGAGILYGAADFIEKYPVKRDIETYIADPSPDAFEAFVIKHRSKLNRDAAGELLERYQQSPSYESNTIAALMSLYEDYINIGSMVGASGALYGLLFAFAYLFPNMEVYIYFLFPVKAKYIAFAAIVFSIYSEFNRAPGDNVAHLAHLSGMLIAFVLLRIWKNDNKTFY